MKIKINANKIKEKNPRHLNYMDTRRKPEKWDESLSSYQDSILHMGFQSGKATCEHAAELETTPVPASSI